jgi:hypothetical protein
MVMSWQFDRWQRRAEKFQAAGVRDDVLRASHRSGRNCGRCGRAFPRARTVWQAPVTTEFKNVWGVTTGHVDVAALFCRKCAAALWSDRDWSGPVQCRGCGRSFVWRSRQYRSQPPQACSVRCKSRLAYNRRRVAPTDRPCVVCGESFTAKRSDAKTCGPTCRQKLRRRALAK